MVQPSRSDGISCGDADLTFQDYVYDGCGMGSVRGTDMQIAIARYTAAMDKRALHGAMCNDGSEAALVASDPFCLTMGRAQLPVAQGTHVFEATEEALAKVAEADLQKPGNWLLPEGGSMLSGDFCDWLDIVFCWGQSQHGPPAANLCHGAAVLPASQTEAGFTVSWGSLAITAAEGGHRMCCLNGSFATSTGTLSAMSCGATEDYAVDMRYLTLIGTSPLEQDRTCVSGRTCGFGEVLGNHLSSSGGMIILDTCRNTTLVPRGVHRLAAMNAWTARAPGCQRLMAYAAMSGS